MSESAKQEKERKYTLSLAMIVRNEAKNLPVLWKSVERIVDEWVVVDTGSTDDTVKVARELGGDRVKVLEVGDRFVKEITACQAEWMRSYYDGIKEGDRVFEFNHARDYSFSQCSKDFILWLDADDILFNSEKLAEIIDANLDPKKQLGIHMLYKYEVDQYQNSIVEHYRERVFPNNGTFRWVGRIHECVMPKVETQYIQVQPEDCHVIHNVPPERRASAFERNIRNLLLDYWEQSEKPDPRTLYYIGEALKVLNEDKSVELFEEYLKHSGWDEERMIACTRLTDIALRQGDNHKALRWAYQSVRECPTQPTGYANVAQCYYALGELANCETFAKQALNTKQVDTMVLLNRKHVQFTPLLLLADLYYQMGELKEAWRYAEAALKVEPCNTHLAAIVSAIKGHFKAEKAGESVKILSDYLQQQGEIAKAIELARVVPLVIQDDPRILATFEFVRKKYFEIVSKNSQSDKEIKDWDSELPEVVMFEKELARRNLKTVWLMSSDYFQQVNTYLTKKGYVVKNQLVGGEKVDATVAFDLIDRMPNSEQLLGDMISTTHKHGLICLSYASFPGARVRRVRAWSSNSIQAALERCNATVWTNVPLPNGTSYISALPGRYAGKASVAFLCGGDNPEEWGPLSIYEGVGGSEEATIYLSQALSKQGHNVTVYCETKTQCTFEGVHWKHHSTLQGDAFDNVILWRSPHFVEKYNFRSRKTYLWLHDVPQKYWFTKERLDKIDKILVLSKFHRSLLPEIPDEKFIITQNGVSCAQFRGADSLERERNRVIYTSSYDRGLERLLDIWLEVLEEVPDARLKIYYGWGVFDTLRAHESQRAWKSKMMEKMKSLPGVEECGRISQFELAEEMLKSNVFAYPCHFEEISCISAMKAQLAGCIPLTTDYAALAETNLTTFGVSGNPERDPKVMEEFKRKLVGYLKKPIDEGKREYMRGKAEEKFSWRKVALDWDKFLQEAING